jgi:hypothetical protein
MLHKYLLKKLGREIDKGKFVLHLSNAQEEITEMFKEKTFYIKTSSFAELELMNLDSLKGKFGYLIADMDRPDLDDFDEFISKAKEFLISNGMLIIIAGNLASFDNIIALIFQNDIALQTRPYRAISPGFIREKLLTKGFAIKNRFWIYGEKMMVMASIK